jgi:hypothetical protein
MRHIVIWETLGEGRGITYVASIRGERRAAVWFLGGHVNRQDAWHVTYRYERDKRWSGCEHATARDAKDFVETVLHGEIR